MIRSRYIAGIVALFCALLAHAADTSHALKTYNHRLLEISRTYQVQLAEILRVRRQGAHDPRSVRVAGEKTRDLALWREKAIARARMEYRKQREHAEAPSAPPLTREQQEREESAARRRAVEEGTKEFWARVARKEPQFSNLWAAQIRREERGQTVFWTATAREDEQFLELWVAQIGAVETEEAAFRESLFSPVE